MMETILGFLVKALGKLMTMLCTAFMSSLNMDVDQYAALFPFISTASAFFKTIGLGLVLLIAAFQLAKFFFGPLSAAKESPVHILIRSAIAAGLVQSGDKIMKVVIEMAKGPYSAMISAVSGMPVMTYTGVNWGSAVTDAVTVLAAGPVGLGIILLGGLVLMIALGINVIKLMMEICERYLMVGILYYTCPLTFSTVASGQTSAIFQRWLSMFFGQCIVMTLSVWSFGIAMSGISALGTKNGAGFILQMLMIIAACRLGLRVDSYMQQIGINTATTGGSLLDEVVGAAGVIGGLARFGRNASQGHTNRDGVLGGIKGSDGKVRPEAFGAGLFGAGVTAARYAHSAYRNGESASNIAKAAREGAEKGFGIRDGAITRGRNATNAREARQAAQRPVTPADTGTMYRSADEQNMVLDDVAKNNGLRLNKDGTLSGGSRATGQFLAANHDKQAAYETAMATMRGGSPEVGEQFLFGSHNDLKHRGPGEDNPSEISKRQHDTLGAAAMESTFGSALKDLHNAPAGTIGQKERDAMKLEQGIKNTVAGSGTENSAVDFRVQDFKGQPGMGRQVTGNLTDEDGKRVSGFEILDQKAFDTLSDKEKGNYLSLQSATGENYYMRSTPVSNADANTPKAPYGADEAYPRDTVRMSGADAENKLFGNGAGNIDSSNSPADSAAVTNGQVIGDVEDKAPAANGSVEADQENAAAMGAMLSGSMQEAIAAGGENSERLQQYAAAMQGAAEGDASHGYLSGVSSSPVDVSDPSKGTQVTASLNDASGATVGSMRLLDQSAYDGLSDSDRSGYTELKSESGQSYYMSMAGVKTGSAAVSSTASGGMVSNGAAASGVAVAGGVAAGGVTVAQDVGGVGPIHSGSVSVGTTAGVQAAGVGAVHSGGTVVPDGGTDHSSGTVSPGGGTSISANDVRGSNVVVGAEAGGYGHRSYNDGPQVTTAGTARDTGELAATNWNGTPIPIEPILSEANYSFGAGICADGTDRVSLGMNGVFQSDDDEDLAQAVKEGFTSQAGVLTFHDAAAKTCQSMDGSQAAIMMYEAKTGNLPACGKYDSVVATAMTRAYTPEAVESAMPVENSAASASPVYNTGESGPAAPVETMGGENAKQLYPAIQRAASGDSTPDEQGRYCDNFGIQGGISSFDYHTPDGTYHVQSMFSQAYREMRDQGMFPDGSSAVEVFPQDVPTGGLAQFTMVTSKVSDGYNSNPTTLAAGGTAYVSTSMSSVASGTIQQPEATPASVAPAETQAPATVQTPVSTPAVTVQTPTVSATIHPGPQPAAPDGGKPSTSSAGAGHTTRPSVTLNTDTSSDAVITPENGQSRSKRKRRRRRNR